MFGKFINALYLFHHQRKLLRYYNRCHKKVKTNLVNFKGKFPIGTKCISCNLCSSFSGVRIPCKSVKLSYSWICHLFNLFPNSFSQPILSPSSPYIFILLYTYSVKPLTKGQLSKWQRASAYDGVTFWPSPCELKF